MDPFLGEIRMFGGAYAPVDWALCNGGILAISSYKALYSLIGDIYGGDGVSTFALPDLRGRIPIGAGTGGGLTARSVGDKGGNEQVTLDATAIPTHTHIFKGTTAPATTSTFGQTVVYATPTDNTYPYANMVPTDGSKPPVPVSLADNTISQTGGSLAHDNVMPCMTLNFIICTNGLFPDFQ